ncbi:MAG TPA: hypothetical protein VLV15_05080, partial [Dongiaceae bacterium]|nr:hypothetical protein [Dongiaceae bacterium]
LQGALAALGALLWANLAARLGGSRAGLVTLVATLGLGVAWTYAGELMTETLYTTLLALVVWLAHGMTERVRRGESPGVARVMGLGATLAAAVLTRPSGFALVGACVAVAVFQPVVRRALVPALVVALVLWSAWPLRNARVLGNPVPSLTSGGINAWQGATGRPIGEGWQIASEHVSLGELGLDRMFWSLAGAEARAHPVAFLGRLVHKARDYVLPPGPRGGQWTHALLWGPALIGAGSLLRRTTPWRSAAVLPVVVWVGHALLATITVSSERYRFPTDGIVLLLGALGIETLLRRPGGVRGVLVVAACMMAGPALALMLHSAM